MIQIDQADFLSKVQPLLVAREMSEAAQVVEQNWTNEDLGTLLDCHAAPVREAAAFALGLVAPMSYIAILAQRLHDPSDAVAAAAEHAMRFIWFRAGNGPSRVLFMDGILAAEQESYEEAVRYFTMALDQDPTFAEPFNQRGMANFFLDRYEEALLDCITAVNHIPQHFGAIAGQGHCYAQMGDLKRARECYRRTLEVNPRMEGVAEAYAQLKDAPL